VNESTIETGSLPSAFNGKIKQKYSEFSV